MLNAPDLAWDPSWSALEALAWSDCAYRMTSVAWDTAGAGGTLVLLLAHGAPLRVALTRFKRRSCVLWEPGPAAEYNPPTS